MRKTVLSGGSLLITDYPIRYVGDPGSTGAQKQIRYTVSDLGTLGGTFSSAEGVSNRGWVDGFSTSPAIQLLTPFFGRTA